MSRISYTLPFHSNQQSVRGFNANRIDIFEQILLLFFIVLTLIAGSVYPGKSYANDGAILEEIVVSSQRREQSLQDVPISITAFTSEDIELNKIERLADYFRLTPNVSFENEGNRRATSISIRGIRNLGGQQNSFGFYIDEFNIAPSNSSAAIDQQLADIERIEVLRGPQGTYFGRNAAGGAINITTKKPSDKFYAKLESGYGRFDTWNVRGVVNAPLADNFFIRVVGFWDETDGFIDNISPTGGSDAEKHRGGRIAVRFQPTNNLTIDLTASLADTDKDFDSLVPNGVLEPLFVGLIGTAIDDGTGFYPQNTDRINQNLAAFSNLKTTITTGNIKYEADNFIINSITGYIDNEYDALRDVDGISFDVFGGTDFSEFDSISQELRIQSKDTGQFEWVIGGLYSEDERSAGVNQAFGTQAPDLGGFTPPQGFVINSLSSMFETESYAFFGELNYHFNDQLTLTVGGRYSHDKITATLTRYDDFGTDFTVPAQSDTFNDFAPRFVLSYNINEDVNTYLTAAKGYKSGGLQLNPDLAVFNVDDSFNKETLWNYEAGIKTTLLNGRLRLNLAGFYINWSDLQVTVNRQLDPAGLANPVDFIQNVKEASSAGFEIEFTALTPIDGLEFSGGIGYLDATFDSFTDCVPFFTNISDCSGLDIPRAPDWTINANAQYNFMLMEGVESYFRVEWAYRDNQFSDVDNATETFVPSYDYWNFRFGADYKNMSLALYIENSFDDNYFTGANLGSGFSGQTVGVNHQHYGLKFAISFGEE